MTRRLCTGLALLLLWGCRGEDNPVLPTTDAECLALAKFGERADSPYILPFHPGEEYLLSQSYCSPAPGSHRYRFAYDFNMPEGTEIINARAGLVVELREHHPDTLALVTTTTPTGSERVRGRVGDGLRHCYLPFDLPGAIGRFLDRTHPSAGILMESVRRVVAGAFHGAARSKPPMVVEGVVRWGVQLPAAFLMAYPLGVGAASIWLAIAGSQVISGAALVIWFFAWTSGGGFGVRER